MRLKRGSGHSGENGDGVHRTIRRGKSTLRTLNRMNDMIPSTRIEGVQIGGTEIYSEEVHVEALRKQVGMVFQRRIRFLNRFMTTSPTGRDSTVSAIKRSWTKSWNRA